jgi:hypothetical protein
MSQTKNQNAWSEVLTAVAMRTCYSWDMMLRRPLKFEVGFKRTTQCYVIKDITLQNQFDGEVASYVIQAYF